MKEIKLSLNISDHDIGYRVDQANKFLDKGLQVKLSMRIMGRARNYPENTIKGKQIMENFVTKIYKGKAQLPIQEKKTYDKVSGLSLTINPTK